MFNMSSIFILIENQHPQIRSMITVLISNLKSVHLVLQTGIIMILSDIKHVKGW